MVTAVRVKDALDAVGSLVANLVLAIRGASAITLIVATLVLGGALAAGHRHRIYDAVILKTLGATRLRLLTAYGIEYLVIGVATAVFGVISGSLAAWLIVAELMHLSFVWLPWPALAAAAGRSRGYRRPRTCRHLRGAGPETGPDPRGICSFCDIPPRTAPIRHKPVVWPYNAATGH